MSFTHLQVRSGYSLLESTMTIERLVKKACDLNFNALALTDKEVLYGTIPFYQSCVAKGIKPIIGMVVDVICSDEEKEECILLAKNNNGYKQLVQISTMIQRQKHSGIQIKD